jgi:hypothetical protein
MSATILNPSAATVSRDWIISRRADLTWFIGSSLLGFAALTALSQGLPILTTTIVLMLLLDGPHVLSTATRTYFDKEARRKLGWHLWVIIPLALVGPAMWATGLGGIFWVAFNSWAQYHIAKQHFGFVMLYKRKTGERGDMQLDRKFLVGSLLLPWALFAYGLLQLPASRKVWAITIAVYVFVFGWYFWRQFNKPVMNVPKLLLLSLVIPLHWIAFYVAGTLTQGLMIAIVATNIGHSFQYHGLMWFHNRNRYRGRPGFGWASIINRRIAYYVATILGLNLLLTALPQYAFHGNQTLLALFLGVNMAHYYLDSKIWRTRDDKDLAAALQL